MFEFGISIMVMAIILKLISMLVSFMTNRSESLDKSNDVKQLFDNAQIGDEFVAYIHRGAKPYSFTLEAKKSDSFVISYKMYKLSVINDMYDEMSAKHAFENYKNASYNQRLSDKKQEDLKMYASAYKSAINE
jgi:hypothetical protein